MNRDKAIEEVIDQLQWAEVLIILTGAGMSADSGIPTYRGENGSWDKVEQEFNLPVTEIMTPGFIQENPVFMWKRFSRGMAHLKGIRPHPGYEILWRWVHERFEDYFVLTSNVDRQFIRAGFSEERLYEIHGAGGFLQCSRPCWGEVWASDYSIFSKIDLHDQNLPTCPNCGEILRPNVLIFQDKTFVPTRIEKQKEAYQEFLKLHQEKNILALEIGAGATIKSIRHHGKRLDRDWKARRIRVNPYEPAIENPHLSLALKAEDALQALDRAWGF